MRIQSGSLGTVLFGLSTILLSSSCVLFPGQAQAGFEWTPPAVQVKATGPKITPPPKMPVDASALDKQAVIPMAPVPSGSVITKKPVQEVLYNDALGFGSDMPLALALRQIIPTEYAFSASRDVDLSQRADWNGGKPWNKVLEEALSPLGLAPVIIDKTVWVMPAEKAASKALLPAAEASPQPASEMVPDVLSASLSKADLSQERQTATHEEKRPDDWFEEALKKPAPREVARLERMNTASSFAQEEEQRYKRAEAQGYGERNEEEDLGYQRRNPISLIKLHEEETAPTQLSPVASSPTVKEPVDAVPTMFSSLDGSEQTKAPTYNATKRAPVFTMSNENYAPKPKKVMNPDEIRYWSAEKGQNLRALLSIWSRESGVELYWNSAQDYVLSQPVSMNGNYADAVKSILMSFNAAPSRPIGHLHPNLPKGPSVLIISDETGS